MARTSGARDDVAALGFRAHSGWAALVALAGSPAQPAVVLRQRLALSEKTPRQPFHAAEGRPFPGAENLIRRATREVQDLGRRGVGDAIAKLRATGHEVVAGGLLCAAGRPLPDLRTILASHALIHAAEGELFRDGLRRASEAHGLRLVEVTERELEERASRALRRPAAELLGRVAQWGKALGPPWTQDQKRATLAAWLALADAGRGRTAGTPAGAGSRRIPARG